LCGFGDDVVTGGDLVCVGNDLPIRPPPGDGEPAGQRTAVARGLQPGFERIEPIANVLQAMPDGLIEGVFEGLQVLPMPADQDGRRRGHESLASLIQPPFRPSDLLLQGQLSR
jgi:hypothetical protein